MFFVLAAAVALALPATATPPPLPIGSDPYTSSGGLWYDSTAVGSVIATNGFTTISLYLVGKYASDGAASIGFSTSSGGAPFVEGLLPGITRAQNPANPYDRVTFPSIAWNQRYGEFLATTLPISNVPSNGDPDTTEPPDVSRSFDGLNWSATPTAVPANGALRPEKNWIGCDNNIFSPYYGNCYVTFDDNDSLPNFDQFHADVSTDGGQTWSAATTDLHSEFGAQPVVLPNGNVVAISEDSSDYDLDATMILSTISTDGGQTWSPGYEVSPLTEHRTFYAPESIRSQSVPTTAVAQNGTIYTVWQDCRFRPNCTQNDLVMSSSVDGQSWTVPERIGVDAITSTVDHFLPALSIRNTTKGSTLGLSYYNVSRANCTAYPSKVTCQMNAAFTTSGNGGATWSKPARLFGPMLAYWLPSTSAGYMVGDYFSSIFPSAYIAPIAVAVAPTGSSYAETIDLPGMSQSAFTFSVGRRAPHLTAALGLDDDAATHAGALRPVYQPVRVIKPRSSVRRHVRRANAL
jgi:hypothetical protein